SLEDVQEQRAEIDAVNDELDITVLQGIEADITDDGLDISREMVEAVDLVVASLHRVPDDPTAAVIAAFEDWPVAVWGHPTNRKLLERDPVDLDLDTIMEFRDANDFVISTDAHRPAALDYLHLGVAQARRGWLEQGDVLTTRPLDDLQDALT
ncbi:MAG: histidinol-phosphatase, partial [Candidatus Nanohaloarchaea archaeon]